MVRALLLAIATLASPLAHENSQKFRRIRGLAGPDNGPIPTLGDRISGVPIWPLAQASVDRGEHGPSDRICFVPPDDGTAGNRLSANPRNRQRENNKGDCVRASVDNGGALDGGRDA